MDELLRIEGVTQEWNPSDQRSVQLISRNKHAIGAIEAMSDVRIEGSRTGTGLLIKSDSSERNTNALHRLEILDQLLRYEADFFHFPVTEGNLSSRVRFVALRETEDLLREILVKPSSIDAKFLSAMFLLHLTVDGKVPPRTRKLRNEAGEHLWQDHSLSVMAQKKSMPTQTGPLRVSQWVNESSSGSQLDPFAPLSTAGNEEDEETSAPAIKKPQARKSRVARGESIVEKSTRSEGVASGEDKSHSREQSHQSAIAPEAHHVEPPRSAKESRAPPIQHPFMPQQSRHATVPEYRPSIMWDRQFVPTGASGILIDFEQTASDEQDNTKNMGEVHRTMQQKKNTVKGGRTFTMQVYLAGIKRILNASTECVMKIDMRVLIGRLVIDNNTVRNEHRNRTFTLSEFSSNFEYQSSQLLRTNFTGMLTSSFQDVLSILRIRLNKGRQLLEEDPVKRKVSYALRCQSRSGEKLVIVIDEDREVAVHGPRKTQGAINWYCVCRTWDARK